MKLGWMEKMAIAKLEKRINQLMPEFLRFFDEKYPMGRFNTNDSLHLGEFVHWALNEHCIKIIVEKGKIVLDYEN